MTDNYTPTPISLDQESLDLLAFLQTVEDRNRSNIVRLAIKDRAARLIQMGIIKIEELPRPEDAEAVPVVTVAK